MGLIVVPGLIALKAYRDRKGTPALLREVNHQIERQQYSKALGYLNRYLELDPNDLDALDLKAKILADSAGDEEAAIAAMPIHNQYPQPRSRAADDPAAAAGVEPQGPGTVQDGGGSRARADPAGDDSARAHRLLARAWRGVGVEGDAAALAEATREYEAAEAKEPAMFEGGELASPGSIGTSSTTRRRPRRPSTARGPEPESAREAGGGPPVRDALLSPARTRAARRSESWNGPSRPIPRTWTRS